MVVTVGAAMKSDVLRGFSYGGDFWVLLDSWHELDRVVTLLVRPDGAVCCMRFMTSSRFDVVEPA